MVKRKLDARGEEVKDEAKSEEEPQGSTKPLATFNGSLTKYGFTSPTKATTTSTSTYVTRSTTKKLRSTLTSPAKPKTKRTNRAGYAPPSKYTHLGPVPDALAPGLICIFIGINPGIATATAGHCYASPTNLFWRLMHSSGLTPDRRLPPSMDQQLPRMYSLGQTNIVGRATKDAAELSKEEMVAGVSVLEEKMRANKPEAVCFVGKVVWEAVWKGLFGRPIKKEEFMWGWQEIVFAKEEGGWEGCRAFVVPSTSGLVAAYSPQFKQDLWKVLGDWVQIRRKERGETAPRVVQVGVEGSSSRIASSLN